MAAAETSGLSSVIKKFSGSAGDFKQSANDNNKNLSRIAKDLYTSMSSHKKDISSLSSAINESLSAANQTSAKIDSTNSLLQQSLQMQSEMLSQLKTIASYMKGGSGKGEDNTAGGLFEKFKPFAGSTAGKVTGAVGAAGLIGAGVTASKDSQTMPFMPGGGKLAPGQADPKEIYDYLIQKGASHTQAMGIMGNITRESSLKPGAFNPNDVNGPSGGLFQHHDNLKRGETRFSDMAKAAGGESGDWKSNWKGQIDFAFSEGDMKKYLSNDYKDSKEAAAAFYKKFERGANFQSDQAKAESHIDRYEKQGFVSGARKGGNPQGEGEPSGSGTSPASPPGSMASMGSGGNGRLDSGSLQPVDGGHKLQPAAAEAYKAMVDAARQEGINWSITDSYRTYDQQVKLAQEKGLYSQGGLAAEPGRSNHGWGTALDLGGGAQAAGSKQNQWLQENAGKYGFSTIPREPWHWEYKGGGVSKPEGSGSGGGYQQADANMGTQGGMIGMNSLGMGGGMGSQSIPMGMGMGGGGLGLGAGLGMMMGGRTGGMVGGLVDMFASLAAPQQQRGPMPQTQASSGNLTPSYAEPGSDNDTAANFFAADKANTAKMLQQKATETAALRETADQAAAKAPEPQKTTAPENQPARQASTNPGTKSDDSMFGKGNWAGDVLRYYGVSNAAA